MANQRMEDTIDRHLGNLATTDNRTTTDRPQNTRGALPLLRTKGTGLVETPSVRRRAVTMVVVTPTEAASILRADPRMEVTEDRERDQMIATSSEQLSLLQEAMDPPPLSSPPSRPRPLPSPRPRPPTPRPPLCRGRHRWRLASARMTSFLLLPNLPPYRKLPQICRKTLTTKETLTTAVKLIQNFLHLTATR